jgi:transaldolase/glucose-6-phosphate isomerase
MVDGAITEARRDNPLRQLQEAGQSVWLDFLSRELLDSGRLSRLIEEDAVSGVTTNPAILEKAISTGSEYEARIEAAVHTTGPDPLALYEQLAISDVRDAADLLRSVFDGSNGKDGWVSLEVSPHLADDCSGTVAEAKRLWEAVDRPNVMMKVPATPAGVCALRELLVDGVPVNVTLLFSCQRYQEVALAYLEALEIRKAQAKSVAEVRSVASFFVSRIDTYMDRQLASIPGGAALQGRIAVANARRAYRLHQELLGSNRWLELAREGAQPQRLLWASTSTKNPEYRDTLYVEELVAPNTVNTLPLETLEAFRDHGRVRPMGAAELELAERELAGLESLGIDLEAACDALLVDGLRKFQVPFDKLLQGLQARVRDFISTSVP